MLVNLLPGLRDLRAPLSAGFIWLLGIWLLVEPGLRGDDSKLTTSLEALVDGAMKQQRLLVVAPREAGPEDLGAILRSSL